MDYSRPPTSGSRMSAREPEIQLMTLPSVQMVADEVVTDVGVASHRQQPANELGENGLPKCWIRVTSPHVRRMKQVALRRKLIAMDQAYSTGRRSAVMSLQPVAQAQLSNGRASATSARDDESPRPPLSRPESSCRTSRPTSAVSFPQEFPARQVLRKFPARKFFSAEATMRARSGNKAGSKPVRVNLPETFWEEFTQDFKFNRPRSATASAAVTPTPPPFPPQPPPALLEQTEQEEASPDPPESDSIAQSETDEVSEPAQRARSATQRPHTGKRVQFNEKEISQVGEEDEGEDADDEYKDINEYYESVRAAAEANDTGYTVALKNMINEFEMLETDVRPRSAASTSSFRVPKAAPKIASAGVRPASSLRRLARPIRVPTNYVDTVTDRFARIYKSSGATGHNNDLVIVEPNGAMVTCSRPNSASSTLSRSSVTNNRTDVRPGSERHSYMHMPLSNVERGTLNAMLRSQYLRAVRPLTVHRRQKAPLKQDLEYVSFWKGAQPQRRNDPYYLY